MDCPKCGYGFSTVSDCRTVGNAKRRRHECCNCGHLYTGYEMYDYDYRRILRENKAIKKIKKIMEDAQNAEN